MRYAQALRYTLLNVVGAVVSIALTAVALLESLFEGILGAVRDELAQTRRPF